MPTARNAVAPAPPDPRIVDECRAFLTVPGRTLEDAYAVGFTPAEVDAAVMGKKEPPSLAEFVQATVKFPLHEWQIKHLCPLLERLRTERGLRIAIHAPPQYGKSIIVSQRAPAWLIGCDPTRRVGLACYNETHATNFGEVVRDLVQGPQFATAFGNDPALKVRKDASAARWSTAAREALMDAQDSFIAMGLSSGFVGKGVDVLFIDDPYKSDDEARSAIVNAKVIRWWGRTAGPRVDDSVNVVVMFHRYHDNDLAGELIAEGFEYLRFPAIGDDNADGADPTGRAVGELLSPMRTREWLEAQKEKDAGTFAGQFQGVPQPETGGFFKVDKLNYCERFEVPALAVQCRAWDLAATEGAGDWTAGVKQGKSEDSRFFITDVHRGRWSTDDVDTEVVDTAKSDGRGVKIHGAQDPGSAGKKVALLFNRMLAGYDVKTEVVSGSKATRAKPFSSQVNAGNVWLVRAPWNKAFVKELQAFVPDNNAGVDDQVDAAADSFNEIAAGYEANTVERQTDPAQRRRYGYA